MERRAGRGGDARLALSFAVAGRQRRRMERRADRGGDARLALSFAVAGRQRRRMERRAGRGCDARLAFFFAVAGGEGGGWSGARVLAVTRGWSRARGDLSNAGAGAARRSSRVELRTRTTTVARGRARRPGAEHDEREQPPTRPVGGERVAAAQPGAASGSVSGAVVEPRPSRAREQRLSHAGSPGSAAWWSEWRCVTSARGVLRALVWCSEASSGLGEVEQAG